MSYFSQKFAKLNLAYSSFKQEVKTDQKKKHKNMLFTTQLNIIVFKDECFLRLKLAILFSLFQI